MANRERVGALGVATALRPALAAARAALEATARALEAVEASLGEHDDELVELSAGAYGLAGATLTRWAREGRLRAWAVERGRLVAWRADLKAAIEAEPARQLRAVAPDDETDDADPLTQALESGELRAGGGR